MTKTEVLIVGAGPTGLTLATVLQRYGIRLRLIDQKNHATETSNALGIHARTLELLEDLNTVEPFIKQGKRIEQACLHSHHKIVAKLNLQTINSIYNCLIILPQALSEKILVTNLKNKGLTVEYDTELVDLFSNKHGHGAIIKHHDKTEKIAPHYIVACDGAHSKVRQLANIPFTGEDIEQQFALADAKVNTDLSLEQLHTFFSDGEILALFPLPSGEVRLVANLNDKNKVPLQAINFSEIIKKRSYNHVRIKSISWSSTFWIHNKIIATMQKNNLFFCGDSAHTHSPVGGQGMNTGMQDAYNLGWKLAFVLQGKASDLLLTSYHQERHPVAKQLVKQTENLTKRLLSKNPLIHFARQHLMPIAMKQASINRQLANRLSMLSLHYPKSDVIHYQSVLSNRSPQPGELAPEIKLLQPYCFSHYLLGKYYWLLIFCGKKMTPEQLKKVSALCEMLEKHYPDQLRFHLVCQQPVKLNRDQLIDDDFSIHQTFNVEHPALCLIRPDKYIAYASAFLNLTGLNQYLEKILLKVDQTHRKHAS